jgi:putative heme-binding domain-containing protein
MKCSWIWALSVAIVVATVPAARAQEAAGGEDDTIGLLVGVLKDTPDPAAQADMLRGINAALEGKRNVKMPAGWQELYPKLAESPNDEVRKQSAKLSAIFGDASTLDAMRKVVLDPSKPPTDRNKALESLLGKNDAALAPLLQGLLKDPAVRESALKGLAGTDDPKTPTAILEAYPSFDETAKRAAVNTLSFRPRFAKALMAAVKEGKVSTKDLTAYTVRQLRSFNDKEIDAWIAQTWGVAKTSNEQKVKEIARYKAMLTPEALKAGDASAGRALFARTCMQCHTLFGEGGKVGPDITGANRQDVDYLLVNIVDPSAVISKDYMVSLVGMKDDDVFTGILVKEDAQTISLATESAVQVLQKSDVKEVRQSELSMMPEGLITPLSKKELIDLITYLRSSSQVPLPGGK